MPGEYRLRHFLMLFWSYNLRGRPSECLPAFDAQLAAVDRYWQICVVCKSFGRRLLWLCIAEVPGLATNSLAWG